jgi:hypothetical protein
LPLFAGIRFHFKSPEELGEEHAVIREANKISRICQGVHRVNVLRLARNLKVSPFQIPAMLYELQRKSEISYDTDQDSFSLVVKRIPKDDTVRLSTNMLQATRTVESNIVSKLNCMYLIARDISEPTVDILLKKMKAQEGNDDSESSFTMQTTHRINDLINTYFKIDNEGKSRGLIVF